MIYALNISYGEFNQARQPYGVKSMISTMNISTQQMRKKKPVIPSLVPPLATVLAMILDFEIIVDFEVGVRKLMLWLFFR